MLQIIISLNALGLLSLSRVELSVLLWFYRFSLYHRRFISSLCAAWVTPFNEHEFIKWTSIPASPHGSSWQQSDRAKPSILHWAFGRACSCKWEIFLTRQAAANWWLKGRNYEKRADNRGSTLEVLNRFSVHLSWAACIASPENLSNSLLEASVVFLNSFGAKESLRLVF